MIPPNDDDLPAIDIAPEEFRRLGYRAIDLLADHFAAMADLPSRAPVPEHVRRELMEAPTPSEPADADALLNDVASKILAYPMGNGSPARLSSSTISWPRGSWTRSMAAAKVASSTLGSSMARARARSF